MDHDGVQKAQATKYISNDFCMIIGPDSNKQKITSSMGTTLDILIHNARSI